MSDAANVLFLLFGGIFFCLWLFLALSCFFSSVIISVNKYNLEQTAFVPASFLPWSWFIFWQRTTEHFTVNNSLRLHCFLRELNIPVPILCQIMEKGFKTGKENILYQILVVYDSQTISSWEKLMMRMASNVSWKLSLSCWPGMGMFPFDRKR